MRTLFSENILTPSPTPAAPPNPFELVFHASASVAGSSVSTQSSPRQHDWLTQYYQNHHHHQHHRASSDPAPAPGHAAAAGHHHRYPRRKGNPRLLFMGLSRSGKSSIQKVVFEKLSPADTLFLEPTTRVETARMQSFVTFESAELPSQLPVTSPDFDHAGLFAHAGAVIWVLDVQDEFLPSISEMIQLIVFLAEQYPRVHFEVFIHKTDGLSDDYKEDTFREVRQRVQDELSDLGLGERSIAYYQTSIFDHSIFEAMSKIVQKLLPQLPAMEALLNKLCSTCRIQKAYLFDTVSKIYVATDASPTFLRDYEVCSDYVDVIVDIKQIYGWQRRPVHLAPGQPQSPASPDDESGDDDNADDENGGNGVGVDHDDSDDAAGEDEGMGESMVTYDRSGDTYIYAREINEYLSLICVMGPGNSVDKRVWIDYNVGILQDALLQVFKV